MPTNTSDPRDTQRIGVGLTVALVLHGLIGIYAIVADPRVLLDQAQNPIEFTLVEPPTPVEPPAEEPPVEEPPVEEPPVEEPPVEEPPVEEPPPVEPPPAEPPPPEPTPIEEPPPPAEVFPEETTPPDAPPPPETLPADDPEPTSDPTPPAVPPDEPPAAPMKVEGAAEDNPDGVQVAPEFMRTKKNSLMGRVLGGGDPLGTSTKRLEDALAFRAERPTSDKRRAETAARSILQDELFEDSVSAGLADDYFRVFKKKLKLAWRPATAQLNDGGASASRIGMTKSFAVNTAAWGEVFDLYKDLAGQYGRADSGGFSVKKGRVGKIREMFRSKQGNFKFHAIAEVVVAHAADGKILTTEFPVASGHSAIDEGMRDAIIKASALMPDKPPERLSKGRAFKSKWRLRATWRMVPPTAVLTGGGWDVTPKGLEVDVPFAIHLSTTVILQTFDNRASDGDATGP